MLSARARFTLVMAPSCKLTSPEENAARKAFAMLQEKKLIKATTQGRKPGMAPVHAALAIRAGELEVAQDAEERGWRWRRRQR